MNVGLLNGRVLYALTEHRREPGLIPPGASPDLTLVQGASVQWEFSEGTTLVDLPTDDSDNKGRNVYGQRSGLSGRYGIGNSFLL